eukprot:s78_g5.t2
MLTELFSLEAHVFAAAHVRVADAKKLSAVVGFAALPALRLLAALCGLASLGVKSCVINDKGSLPRFDLFHFEWSICSWKVREALCGLASLGVKSCVINDKGSLPRFDLFHFEWSICSWKVRCVLAEKGIPWTSWQLKAPLHNNYHPAYVQLRSLGNPGGGRLVGEVFSGATAASSQGFDPLAVPTLLDRQKKKVVVDSKVICEYLELELPEPRLVPKEYQEVIAKHLSLVDETPHMGMFYGLHLAETPKDPIVKKFAELTKGSQKGQLKTIDKYLADPSLPIHLRPLYEAKRKKTSMAQLKVGVNCTREAFHEMHATVKSFLGQLESDLKQSGGPYICGNTYTMADLVWFTSLLRLLELGYEDWFSGRALPCVHAYAARILRRTELARATYLSGVLPNVGQFTEYVGKFCFDYKPVPLDQTFAKTQHHEHDTRDGVAAAEGPAYDAGQSNL